MTDGVPPRASRIETEDASVSHQFRQWLKAVLSGRNDTTLRDTIEELIEEGDDGEASIAAHERTLIANILDLRDLTVADIMIPRADIVSVDIETTWQDLVSLMAERPHSRIPVYRETLDDVVGFVHLKDVLARVAKDRSFELREIVRDVLIVAPSVPVLDLLLDMRRNRSHIALVVDEFGGIDGLITIEDLVEEIVGEIEDEHDREALPQMDVRPDGTVLADARVSVEDFEALTGPILEEEEREEIDTLGGLVFALAGRVPSRGEVLSHPSGFEVEVIDADPRRIKRLKLLNLPPLREAEGERDD